VNGLINPSVWRRGYAVPFLVLFAFNILAFLAFTLPRSLQERRMAARALALREVITAKREEIAGVRRQADVIKANTQQTQQFYTDVVHPCMESRADVLEHLSATAAQLGIQAPRVASSEDDVKGAPLKKMNILMPLSGTYQQLGTILQKVEQSPDFLVVDGVAIRERRQEAGSSGELDIKLATYCRSDAMPAKPGRRRPS
jgi:Tfp pilus assembly protein PilO